MSGITVDQLIDAYVEWLLLVLVVFFVVGLCLYIEEWRSEARRRGVKWWEL